VKGEKEMPLSIPASSSEGQVFSLFVSRRQHYDLDFHNKRTFDAVSAHEENHMVRLTLTRRDAEQICAQMDESISLKLLYDTPRPIPVEFRQSQVEKTRDCFRRWRHWHNETMMDRDKFRAVLFSHAMPLDALFLWAIFTMDETLSVNVSGMPLRIAFGIAANCDTRSLAFGLVKIELTIPLTFLAFRECPATWPYRACICA
jgi:hypothetical protein